MTLDKRISELRKGIETMPSMSDVIEAMQSGNRARADEIVGIEERLTTDFNGVFEEFRSDPNNQKKLEDYASILLDIRPGMTLDGLMKVVFLLYINNSVEGMKMSFADVGSINFNQLVGEYIEWDKFREHFGDSQIPDEFFDTEGRDVVSHMSGGKAKEHMEAIFLAMKAKFKF